MYRHHIITTIISAMHVAMLMATRKYHTLFQFFIQTTPHHIVHTIPVRLIFVYAMLYKEYTNHMNRLLQFTVSGRGGGGATLDPY